MAIARRKDVSTADIKRAGAGVYADTVNRKYDISTQDKVRAAITYFARARNQAFYTRAEKRIVAKRIIAAAKKFGINVSEDSYLRKLAK